MFPTRMPGVSVGEALCPWGTTGVRPTDCALAADTVTMASTAVVMAMTVRFTCMTRIPPKKSESVDRLSPTRAEHQGDQTLDYRCPAPFNAKRARFNPSASAVKAPRPAGTPLRRRK